MNRQRTTAGATVMMAALASIAWSMPGEAPGSESGAPPLSSMTRGAVELGSIGPLTFAPDGTLFLGDTYGAAIYAVDLEERAADDTGALGAEQIDARVGSLLGVPRDHVVIHDLAVSPVSRAVYLTVSRRTDTEPMSIRNSPLADTTSHLIRLDADGLAEIRLDDVNHQRADIRDVRHAEMDRWGRDRRAWNILEMAFVDDTLYVSGMSNEEWSARLRRLPYPFDGHVESDGIGIFHTAHGRFETDAPARVFAPYEHDGERRIFAGFSCTPLVDFSVAEMDRDERVEGKTIAELGAGNHVLDMISVRHGGETFFFLANHLHDFMRLARSDFDGASTLDRPTGRGGIDRTPMPGFDGVMRLASDRDERIVLLSGDHERGFDLRTESVAAMVR